MERLPIVVDLDAAKRECRVSKSKWSVCCRRLATAAALQMVLDDGSTTAWGQNVVETEGSVRKRRLSRLKGISTAAGEDAWSG